jgi:hypothetical protein
MFLARFSADGAFEWVELVTDAGGGSITTIDDGSVLVFGGAPGGCVFDPGGPNETEALVMWDFIAKYGSGGAFEQVWHTDGPPPYEGMDFAAGPDGTFALVGHFLGEVGFWGEEPDPVTLTSDEELYDGFVVQQSF